MRSWYWETEKWVGLGCIMWNSQIINKNLCFFFKRSYLFVILEEKEKCFFCEQLRFPYVYIQINTHTWPLILQTFICVCTNGNFSSLWLFLILLFNVKKRVGDDCLNLFPNYNPSTLNSQHSWKHSFIYRTLSWSFAPGETKK